MSGLLHARPDLQGEAAVAARNGSTSAADLADWWRSFDDPLLTSLVERGLAQNLDLQQARARVLQARAALKGANAALLPPHRSAVRWAKIINRCKRPSAASAALFRNFSDLRRCTKSIWAQAGKSICSEAVTQRAMPRAPTGKPPKRAP
jgi:hypothetical protein